MHTTSNAYALTDTFVHKKCGFNNATRRRKTARKSLRLPLTRVSVPLADSAMGAEPTTREATWRSQKRLRARRQRRRRRLAKQPRSAQQSARLRRQPSGQRRRQPRSAQQSAPQRRQPRSAQQSAPQRRQPRSAQPRRQRAAARSHSNHEGPHHLVRAFVCSGLAAYLAATSAKTTDVQSSSSSKAALRSAARSSA